MDHADGMADILRIIRDDDELIAAAKSKPAHIRIELSGITGYNGMFTSSDAQTLAVRMLDGVCAALSD